MAAGGGGGVPQFASLYVGDLHSDVTEAMLYEIFNSVGPVASIRICRDSVTRRSLCYGYVNFHSVSDAERALDTLNYSSIKGRSCRIMWSQRDPSMRRSGAGNIYVKNLDKNIDNKALYDTFSLFGNILSCKVASDSTGKSYGYGFVHYETEEAAKQAIERVNGMQIGEKTVQVHEFVKRGERENPALKTYTNLYVKNFPDSWDDAKITEEFSKHGTVTAMCIREHKKGMKMAFVNMEDHEGAEKAVTELHMKELRTPEEIEKAKEEGKEEEQGPDGHPAGKLYVQRAQTKIERKQELKGKFPAPPPKESSPQGVNLYVKNLDESTDEAALKALFEPFGTITSAFSPLDDKGKSKGFGFVCFQSPDEATKAVTEMHLKVVKGKPLYVGLAEKKEARQERLRQRYAPGAGGGAPISTKGAKGAGKGAGGASMPGGMGAGMTGGMMGGAMMGAGMPGMSGMSGMSGMTGMAGMGGGMMNGMAGKGGPQMMGMMPQAMMGMMRPGMMPQAMMGAKGGPMMGNPQMMGMMRPGMMPPGMMQNMMRLQMQGAMMRPQMPGVGMMPGAMGAMGARPMQPQALPAAMGATPGAPLSASALAAAPPSVQKQMIGEKLFLAIAKYQPELAGKITGMMLEMDNSELLILLESEQQLKSKVDEALRVLPADGSK